MTIKTTSIRRKRKRVKIEKENESIETNRPHVNEKENVIAIEIKTAAKKTRKRKD